MIALPITPELEYVSRRNIWFQQPAEALADTDHFIAHVLTYGVAEDVATLRRYVSDNELREALRNTPAGIMDVRSWHYWHLMLDMYPPPPMPQRKLPD